MLRIHVTKLYLMTKNNQQKFKSSRFPLFIEQTHTYKVHKNSLVKLGVHYMDNKTKPLDV